MDRQKTELDLLTCELIFDELDLVAGGRMASTQCGLTIHSPAVPGRCLQQSMESFTIFGDGRGKFLSNHSRALFLAHWRV
jgi:hypothetical protein